MTLRWSAFLIALVLGCIVAAWLVARPERDAPVTSNDQPTEILPRAVSTPTLTGAVGYWWSEEGLAALRQHIDQLDVITVFFYGVTPDGSVVRGGGISPNTEREIIELAQLHGKQAWLGVNDFEEAVRTDGILSNQDVRGRHVEDLVKLLENRGYDGVVIDYEGVRSGNTRAFTGYIADLSRTLRARNKGIGVTIPAQLDEDAWLNVDVGAIAPYIDRFELQGYQEFGEGTQAGPVASIGWLRTLVADALQRGMPASKIVLGMAFTSNEWMVDAEETHAGDMTTREALARLAEVGGTVQWDVGRQSSYATFAGPDGDQRIMWLEDARGAQAKINLARSYGLQGVFFWFLSGEDPVLWESLEQARNN